MTVINNRLRPVMLKNMRTMVKKQINPKTKPCTMLQNFRKTAKTLGLEKNTLKDSTITKAIIVNAPSFLNPNKTGAIIHSIISSLNKDGLAPNSELGLLGMSSSIFSEIKDNSLSTIKNIDDQIFNNIIDSAESRSKFIGNVLNIIDGKRGHYNKSNDTLIMMHGNIASDLKIKTSTKKSEVIKKIAPGSGYIMNGKFHLPVESSWRLAVAMNWLEKLTDAKLIKNSTIEHEGDLLNISWAALDQLENVQNNILWRTEMSTHVFDLLPERKAIGDMLFYYPFLKSSIHYQRSTSKPDKIN